LDDGQVTDGHVVLEIDVAEHQILLRNWKVLQLHDDQLGAGDGVRGLHRDDKGGRCHRLDINLNRTTLVSNS
jgi:hypothetical protein